MKIHYLIALHVAKLEPMSTMPPHIKFPMDIFAFPLRNPYLNPVIGNKERSVITPTSVSQSKMGGVASQLQKCSSADCWQVPCLPQEHWKSVCSLPLMSIQDATCFK